MHTLVIGYGGDESGHGRYCRAFVEALRSAGEDAALHSVSPMPRHRLLERPGFKQLDRSIRTASNALGSMNAIRRVDPAVVHFQLLTPTIDRWWIPHLSTKRLRVMTVHNVEPHQQSAASTASTLSAIYDAMDALIVHSNANKRRLVELHPKLGQKVSVIPHGIWRAMAEVARGEALRELGVPTGRPVILFFGVIRRNKGLHLLLESLAHLRDAEPAPLLLVAGQPSTVDGFAEYAARIRDLGLEGSVMTHLQRVPESRMPLYYAAADVVALPYEPTFQAQSGILVDAYAYGVPLVVTDVGGIGETVRGDDTGIVVERRDPAEFASALRRLLTDPGARAAAARRMRELAQGAYSWAAVGARTREIYVATEQSVTGVARERQERMRTDARA
jgi:D-inositol-3-phosphate glycosyltransferase